MMIFLVLLFFLFGVLFGSFFNVVGLRLPKKEPFVSNRSICPACKRTLSWYELIPLLSILFLQGKCKGCHKEISPFYPIIEFITGLLFAFSFAHIGFHVELITALLTISMLMIVLVSDLTYMVIPNQVLLFFLPLFIVMRMMQPLQPWWSAIGGAIIGFTLIALIIFVSQGGMGGGDMKLLGVLGIILGTKKIVLTFIIACSLGAIIGLVLLAVNVIDRKQPIPFGPYIVAATLLVYFYGEQLIQSYVAFF